MQGFEAVREEPTAGKKPVKYWRLTEEAVTHSMQSTTRYWKQMNYKKSMASDPPASQRQQSEAKGKGEGTRFTARLQSLGHSIHGLSPDKYQREQLESVGTRPPGFSTRCASTRAACLSVKLRIPKTTV